MSASSFDPHAASSETASKIWDIIADQSVCMMVTIDRGAIRARPMASVVRGEESTIYFFTHRNTHKDEEIAGDDRVCLTFSDKRRNVYVSLSGSMQESQDVAQKERLWSLLMKAELPEGPQDPSVVLLVFTPEIGEFWDGPSSRVVVAAKMAAAIVTGKQADLGTNRKTDF